MTLTEVIDSLDMLVDDFRGTEAESASEALSWAIRYMREMRKLKQELSTMQELNEALNRRNIALNEELKALYCNCDIKEIRIDQVPTCECCNRPIFMEEG